MSTTPQQATAPTECCIKCSSKELDSYVQLGVAMEKRFNACAPVLRLPHEVLREVITLVALSWPPVYNGWVHSHSPIAFCYGMAYARPSLSRLPRRCPSASFPLGRGYLYLPQRI
jgi:hypothetical protein